MKKLILVLIACVLSVSGCEKKSSVIFDARFGDIREDVIKLIADKEIPSISIAVAEGGNIIWEESFGFSDIENKVSATPHTKYRLGSIAKTITATGLMLLVENGQVDLDKPAKEYLGDLKLKMYAGSDEDVTVRSILNHRSGMPAYCSYIFEDEPERARSFRETLGRYGIITFSPGGSFIYSNLGYQLIAYLISEVSGISYPQYIRENVFLPLGMLSAEARDGKDPVEMTAVTYNPDFNRIPPYSASHFGSADIYCSAHDLIRFAMFHLKNHLPDQEAILTDESIDRMQEAYPPQNTSYGIGWYFDIDELGNRSIYHAGAVPGANAFVRIFPSENFAFVILCNSEFDGLYELQKSICAAMIPELAELPTDQPDGGNQPPELPEVYYGKWEGKIVTYDGEIKVLLTMNEAKEVTISMAGQSDSGVDFFVATDNFLLGEFPGSIPTSDCEHYPNHVRLAIIRQGNMMNGVATGVGWHEERQASYEFSSWIELRKIE